MTKKQKEMSLHDKAVRLCEGGIAECMGQFVKAVAIDTTDLPCIDCGMDSICRDELCDLCAECDNLTNENHILVLACEQPDKN